jgi:hypothetical protein
MFFVQITVTPMFSPQADLSAMSHWNWLGVKTTECVRRNYEDIRHCIRL